MKAASACIIAAAIVIGASIVAYTERHRYLQYRMMGNVDIVLRINRLTGDICWIAGGAGKLLASAAFEEQYKMCPGSDEKPSIRPVLR